MARPRNRPQIPDVPAQSPEDEDGPVLTARQRLAIEHIVSGKTDIETAAIIGVTGPTISRWRNLNPTWAAAERKAEDELVARTRRRLRTLTTRAVQALEEVMDGTVTKQDEDGNPFEVKADPQHRIAAAKTILDRAGVTEIKGVELTGANGAPVQVDVRATLLQAARSLTDAELGLTDETP